MLSKIPILTGFIFAIIYPLCFWVSAKEPLKDGFHKFHIGLPNFVGGVVLVVLLLSDISFSTKVVIVIWKATLLSVSSYSWKKESPSPILMSLPFLPGVYAFESLLLEWGIIGWPACFMSILAGFILCSSLFAMNLGHWYLNVHGLPISHLRRATYIFWGCVALRALLDSYLIFTSKILHDGDVLFIYQFIQRMDGFLLLVALFFGTLFPLVTLYFVKGTLDVKNNQSATGILYVILSAVLIGDIAYKYYLIKFGVVL